MKNPKLIFSLSAAVIVSVGVGILCQNQFDLKSSASLWIPNMNSTAPLTSIISNPAINTSASFKKSVLTEVKSPFARTLRLRNKVLRTPEEKAEFFTALSSLVKIEEAQKILTTRHPALENDYNREEITARMRAIEFLGAAAGWNQNPSRHAVINTLHQAFLAPVPAQQGLYRSSIIGDKVEIYGLLASIDQAASDRVLAEVSGTPDEKIIKYAKNYFKVN